MAIAFRASGAWAAGTTSVAPALPAGVAAGDIMVMFVGCKPFDTTIVTPSGWTLLEFGNGSNGTDASAVDAGSVAYATWYREWQSGDASPTITLTGGNVGLGVIHAFSKSASRVWNALASKDSDTSANTTLVFGMGVVPIEVDDLLIHNAVIAGNNSTFGTPTITTVGATIGTVTETPATEGTTALGNDLEASASYAICTAGPSTGVTQCSWTLSVAQRGGGSLVRLRESSIEEDYYREPRAVDNAGIVTVFS